MKLKLLLIVILCFIISGAYAELFKLSNGRIFDGHVVASNENWITLADEMQHPAFIKLNPEPKVYIGDGKVVTINHNEDSGKGNWDILDEYYTNQDLIVNYVGVYLSNKIKYYIGMGTWGTYLDTNITWVTNGYILDCSSIMINEMKMHDIR